MALCWMKAFAEAARCNQFNLGRVLSVPISLTSYYCDRCFSASTKSTVPFSVTDYGSAGKKLTKPFCAALEHEHRREQCTNSHLSSMTRTMHSTSCVHLAANWFSNSRLLNFGHHTVVAALQSTLNRSSATLKHVDNSRTIGLSQSTSSKNYKKWSISAVVRQLVCHHSCFIISLCYQLSFLHGRSGV